MKTTLQLFFLFAALTSLGQSVGVRISTNTALTQGDQVIWSGSAWVTYGKGTNGQVLTMDGTNVVWATPSGGGGGGSGTVTSVGASTTVSGLGFSVTSPTTTPSLSLTGVVAVASGGTGGTNAATARSNLGVLSSRWLTGFGSPSDYSEGIGTYYVNLETYQVWEQTGVSTFETIPFFVMGEGVYSYLDQPNTFANTNTFAGPVVLLSGISGNGTLLTNLNGTEIRSGTVAEARIDPAVARLASPAFTGSPTAPTASPGTSNTVLATTAFVLQNGGGGGDVTQSGNNTFTGTNSFSGTTTFNDLAIGMITVVSNLTVPNNAYGAGWNGSTNVPNENSVYDEMELRAPKASPAFTTSATIGGTNILDYAASHLTEAEASALYQRTNAVLTATVAGTAVSVAQTNAVSFGAPTLYVGTTNVAVAVAAKAPIAGPSFTGTATNTGSFGAPTLYVGSTNVAAALASAGGSGLTNGGTIASGTITNLTTAGITMDGQTRTNWSTAFAFFQESHFSASDSFGSQFGTWPWSTIALSGGTITRMDALAGGSHPGIYRPNSGANANGGMAVRLGVNNQFLVTSNLIDEVVFRIEGTNEIFHAMGWSDAITAADPVDCLETTIGRGADYNLLEGRARSNSSETVTSDGYRVSLSTWYRRTIEVNGDATEATFRLYSGDSYPGTLLWSNTVSANLPTGSGRVLGHGTIHWKTSSGSSTALMLLDYIAVADGEGKKKKSW